MQPMRAAILVVGSELLGPDRVDSNSLFLSQTLRRYGVGLVRKSIVGDGVDDIAAELTALLADADLVLVCGGLGPTADDVTREGTAQAMGRRLVENAEQLAVLREKFARFGMRMADTNLKQAELIEGARVLPNPRGSAPGQFVEDEGKAVFLFPGVPRELKGLIRSELEPWLKVNTDGEALETRILRVACMGESTLEERILPAYEEFGREAISVLASAGEIQVRVTAGGGSDERTARLQSMTRSLRLLIGGSVYSEGENTSLEKVVGALLASHGRTVVTAESCTGGLIAQRLTAVPGSSAYFLGGVVTYSDHLKAQLLAVPPEMIAEHGAVSQEVVRWMASGAKELLGADYALAVSGIAGPGGGTVDKPVGLVYVCLAGQGDPKIKELRLPGDRERVRWLTSQWALDLLRRELLRTGGAQESVPAFARGDGG
jgi:nicotinamide-nucleotide amidase